MLRSAIRKFLNKRGYDIIKKPYLGNLYPNLSDNKSDYYCETPIGNYFLPIDAGKDGVADSMKRGNFFEQENIIIAKRFIKKGTTVLDVGANFGQMAIEFSKLVGDDGSVYAFEGQEKVFQYLEKNIAANNCKNVIAKYGAVYHKNDLVVIFPDPEISKENPYSANAINPKILKGKEVKTFTIDSLQINSPISFMKVDVQGADLFAMLGAKETILKNRMPIFFEFEEQFQAQFETNFQDYVDFVQEIGYKFVETASSINYLISPK